MRTTYNISIILSCAALAIVLLASTPALAARGQGVTTDQLPEELRGLTIENKFIRGQGVPIGRVRTLRGHLLVRHGNSPQVYFAARGDNLYAHDELFTLKKSRVRIRFTTADIVNMGADTNIRVDELVDDRKKRVKRTKMNMLRGKAMFYVMRLMKYNKVDTQITTPTAVCGVRGTKFGLIVQKKTDNLWSMGQPLYLADASGMPLSNLLAANGSADSLTVMLMEAGTGFIKSGGVTTTLNTGQTGTSGPAGPPAVTPTDPNVSRSLNNETGSGPTPIDDDDNGDQGGGEPPIYDPRPPIDEVTQQGGQRPFEHYGYFSALLSRVSPSPWPEEVYHAQKRHNHDNDGEPEPVPPGIVGTAVTGGGDVVAFHPPPQPGLEPVLDKVDTPFEGAATNLNLPVTAFKIGFNAFQEWGFWEVPMTFMSDSGSYTYMLQGVCVHGNRPTPEALGNLAGISGHYTGNAWGLLQMGGTKSILTGTMEADLVLGSPTAQNFKVLTQDSSGNRVDIFQTGAITFDANGEADLFHTSNVDMQIGGMSANTGRGTLGVFDNGAAVGGTAGMEYSGDAAVVGFQGTK